MTEDYENEDTDIGSAEPQYTETERAALAQGWNPQKSKTAEQWMADGDFKQRMERNNNELKQRVDLLIAENAKVRIESKREGYQQALNDLQAKQFEAAQLGDADAVLKYQNQIIKKSQELAQADAAYQQLAQPAYIPQPPVQAAQPVPQDDVMAYTEWVGRNTWFNQDVSLRKAAEGFFNAAVARGLSTREAFKEVDNRIKAAYPESFGHRAAPVSGVEFMNTRKPRQDKTSASALPSEWKEALEDAKRRKIVKDERTEKVWLKAAWQEIEKSQ